MTLTNNTLDKLAIWERCKEAATYLDEHYPEWPSTIDISALKMDHAQNCVCGQLFDNFYSLRAEEIVNKFLWAFEDPAEDELSDELTPAYWDLLNNYWKQLIQERNETT